MNAAQRKVLIFAGLGLLFLILVGGFFVLFERVETTERVPPTGEARQNPYLAMTRLFDALGYETITHRRLPVPESYLGDAVLFWMAPDRNINPDDLDAWRIWVENGGHFVLIQPREAIDPMLEAFGFVHTDPPTLAHKEALLAMANGETSDETSDEDGRRIDGPYELLAFTAHVLNWDAVEVDWKAIDTSGQIIARSKPLSNGRVTVLTGASPFTNTYIGDGDQALLIARLLELFPVEDDERVLVVLFGQRVSWMSHVASFFWPSLLTLAFILILAISVGFRRYGPVEPVPEPGRRSRREHIEAMGRFMWNRDAAEVLLAATREALVHRIATRRPSLNGLEDKERDALIAEELGVTEIEARRLLKAPAPHTPNTFSNTIETLETHRRSL
jgi:hypothetical protein